MRVPAVPATAASTAWAVRSSCTPNRVSSSRIGATNCSGYVIDRLYFGQRVQKNLPCLYGGHAASKGPALTYRDVELGAEQHRPVVVLRRPLGECRDARR